MRLSGHLVGRAEELGSLDMLITRLDEDEPAALELAGEPGIGKSRLLSELATRARDLGHTVLAGRATELERGLPFSVFVDALDDYLMALDPRRLEALDEGVRVELATVFPSLETHADRRPAAMQEERYRSYRAVRQLLELVARPHPLVLVLDDVHWADSASIELLDTLLRRPPSAPVLIALAVRPRQMDDRLSATVERAYRSGMLERIELGPLSVEEARELVGAIAGGGESTPLYEETGGNPFYLEQLARTAGRRPGAPSHRGMSFDGVDVPPVVAAALGEELGLLSERTRRVLEGASVAGDPFEPELAAAAADVSEADVLDALDELLALDLVRQTDIPRRFRFRHPLVRRAVYELTPGGRRLGAHERCARWLRERGAPPSARAHHAEHAAREGDLSAVALLRDAGEAAASRAPASAAQWFGSALRLLPPSAPSEERIELLLARATSEAAVGHFGDAHASLLEALAIVPPGDEALLVRVTTGCAQAEHLLGLQQNAQAHLETALASLRERSSAQAAKLMIELAVDKFHVADWAEMRAWAARAIDTAQPLDDPALLAAAFGIQAWAASLAGAGATAQAQCDAAAELVDGLPDAVVARRIDALAHLAAAELYLDRFRAGVEHARRGVELSRATAHGDLFPLLIPALGSCLWVIGRPAESAEVIDGAIEAARLIGNQHALGWHLFNRTFAAVAEGDLETALATAQESVELASSLVPGPVRGHAYVALAYALLERGEPARAAEVLVANVGGEELRMIGGGWRAHYLMFLTRARVETGERPAAERAAQAARVCAGEVGLPKADAMAELSAAWLSLGAGDALDAARRASTAAGLLDDAGDLFDAARARQLAGRAFASGGDRERAVASLTEAATAFESFGSARYRDEVERELRKLGHRTRAHRQSGARNGPAALSARELEVARLVVERKTNPEIAAELFLSQKTVETHLRNAFRKLDVSSRAELARAVERADRGS
jgi:DNA-binding NarL/FixJ family response regulator